MKKKNEKGKITISRNSNNLVSIKVTRGGYIDFIEILIKPEEFGLALTGLAFQECELVEKVEE